MCSRTSILQCKVLLSVIDLNYTFKFPRLSSSTTILILVAKSLWLAGLFQATWKRHTSNSESNVFIARMRNVS